MKRRCNMKRIKRVGGAVAATAVAGLVLSGCSAESSEGSGPVTLTLWHNTQDPQAVLDLYSAYEEASGNTIELIPITSDGFEDATLTKWATGDRPDILEFHVTSSYITMLNPTENLRDLSNEEFVGKSGTLYDIGGRGSDGNVYAAITTFPEVWGLYYNRQVLADNGLEPAVTAADLFAQCEILSAAGIPTLHESGGSLWPPVAIPFLYSTTTADADWSDKILAQEAKLDDPDSPLLGGIELRKELQDTGCLNSDITTATFEDSVQAVFEGEAAYEMIHSNIASVYLDAAGGDVALLDSTVGFTSWGGDEQATVINPGPIGSYLLPRTGDAAKEAAALEFIRFVTGEGYDAYIKSSGTFPVIEGVDDPDTSELLKAIKAAYDEGPTLAMNQADLPGGLSGAVPLLQEQIAGQKTPQQVVTDLQSQMATAANAIGLEGW